MYIDLFPFKANKALEDILLPITLQNFCDKETERNIKSILLLTWAKNNVKLISLNVLALKWEALDIFTKMIKTLFNKAISKL